MKMAFNLKNFALTLIHSTLLTVMVCLVTPRSSNAATLTLDFFGSFDGSLAPFGSGSFNGSFTYDPSVPGVPSGADRLLPTLNQFSVNFFHVSGDILFSISNDSPLSFSAYYAQSSTRTQFFMSGVSDDSRSQLNNLSLWLDSSALGQAPTIFVEGSAYHNRGYVIRRTFYSYSSPISTKVKSAAVKIRQDTVLTAIPTPFLLPGLTCLWIGLQLKHRD